MDELTGLFELNIESIEQSRDKRGCLDYSIRFTNGHSVEFKVTVNDIIESGVLHNPRRVLAQKAEIAYKLKYQNSGGRRGE